jgi:hypothetical protein
VLSRQADRSIGGDRRRRSPAGAIGEPAAPAITLAELIIGGPLASVDITDEMSVQDAIEVEWTKIPLGSGIQEAPSKLGKGL